MFTNTLLWLVERRKIMFLNIFLALSYFLGIPFIFILVLSLTITTRKTDEVYKNWRI